MIKPRLYADDNREVVELSLLVLGETLALAHPIIPFVTEELWDNVPGADGLLLVHRYPEPDEALRDEAAEADVRRAIAATQELRGWRDRVGAAAGKAVPARLEAEGYESTAEHIARLARVEWSADGGEPVATVGVPGGSILVLASEAVDVEAAAKRAEAQRATLEKEIARAEGKLANQGFVAKAPPEVVEKERAQARGAQAGAGRPLSTWRLEDAEAHLLSLELFGMRFGLERMRRLLTVLGSPQERFRSIHVVGTNGKSSTARMTAALLEAHGVRTGHVPVAAPDLVRRADPDRRRRSRRRRLRRGRAAAPRRPPPRSTARSRRTTASRSSSCWPPPRSPSSPARASRSPWSRPASAAATTPPTCSARRSWCSPTSGSSTRAGSARRCPTSRARSSPWCGAAPRS